MRTTGLSRIAAAITFSAFTPTGMAADAPQMPMHGGMHHPHHGMMGSMGPGMRGSMGPGMMGCPMMRGHAMPQLPAGNEKLQLQMQAEIMQKVGEILAKYASQIKSP